MHFTLARLLLATLMIALTAQSGWAAWLRPEGQGFMSSSLTLENSDGSGLRSVSQEVFVEYGWRPRLTVGAKGRSDSDGTYEGQVFLRFPVVSESQGSKLSAEIGLGTATEDLVRFDTFLKTGLSFGRGIRVGRWDGWFATDAEVQWPLADGDALFKLDATLGVTLLDRFQVMAQAFYFRDRFSDGLTLSSSVIYAPKRGRFRYVLGVEREIGVSTSSGTASDTRIKLSLWRSF